MHFQSNIKLIRAITGLNQEDFAKLIKSKKSNIKTYETTSTVPNYSTLLQISELTGVEVEDLEGKKLTRSDITIKSTSNTELDNIHKEIASLKQIVAELSELKKILKGYTDANSTDKKENTSGNAANPDGRTFAQLDQGRFGSKKVVKAVAAPRKKGK